MVQNLLKNLNQNFIILKKIREVELYKWITKTKLGTEVIRVLHIKQLRDWDYAIGEEELTLMRVGQKIAYSLKKYVPADIEDTKNILTV